jgi:hypothetical protein
MDRHLEHLDEITKRQFGTSAALAGRGDDSRGPGRLEIRLDGRIIGSGPSFQAALQDVTRRTTNTNRRP